MLSRPRRRPRSRCGTAASAGFMVGVHRDESWGPNVWVEAAGHAVEQAEDIRDLYAFLADRWYADGRTAHTALVPSTDPDGCRRLVPGGLRPPARARGAPDTGPRGDSRRSRGCGRSGRPSIATSTSSPASTSCSPTIRRARPSSRTGGCRRSPRPPPRTPTTSTTPATSRSLPSSTAPSSATTTALLGRRVGGKRRPDPSARRRLPRLRRGLPRGPRPRDRSRARACGPALVGPGGPPCGGDRLADDEPACVTRLDRPRLSPDLLPGPPQAVKLPLLSGSRLVLGTLPDEAEILTPPAPLDALRDVRAAVAEALRYPLSGEPLDQLVSRRRSGDDRREPPAPTAPGCGRRPAPRGARGSSRRARVGRGRSRRPDDPGRGRARAAREPRRARLAPAAGAGP